MPGRDADAARDRGGSAAWRGDLRRSLAPAAPASEPRAAGFRAVGVAVAKLAAPIIAKRGGGRLGRLKLIWPTIAGADWAFLTQPAALARDGALKLLVVPSAALELQHRAPLLIERINSFLGGVVVTRLVLVQALPPPPSLSANPAPCPLTPDEASALERALADVADPALRVALAGLGRVVLASQPLPPTIAPASRTR